MHASSHEGGMASPSHCPIARIKRETGRLREVYGSFFQFIYRVYHVAYCIFVSPTPQNHSCVLPQGSRAQVHGANQP